MTHTRSFAKSIPLKARIKSSLTTASWVVRLTYAMSSIIDQGQFPARSLGKDDITPYIPKEMFEVFAYSQYK